MDPSFSPDYSTARARFIDAALTAEARPQLQRGLRVRAARISTPTSPARPRSARQAFVAISGTHGLEGFFGSAVQAEWMRRGEHLRLPPGSAVLMIHAINPHAFAWQRQVDEDNVDLDRNWIDFAKALPESAGYRTTRDRAVPRRLVGPQPGRDRPAARGPDRAPWVGRVPAGARGRAMGASARIFYGGTAPSWSRTTLSRILQSSLVYAHRALIVDFRTGAGPVGHAVPIVHRARSDPARAHAFLGRCLGHAAVRCG